MALETPIWNLSLEAGADLSSNQYYAIDLNSSGQAVLAGAGAKIVGVVQNAPVSGEAATVMVLGRSKGIAGAAVTAGAELEIDASGRFITLSTGTSVGFALESATQAGDIISVVLK